MVCLAVAAGALMSIASLIGKPDGESTRVVTGDAINHFVIAGEHFLNFIFLPILIVLANALRMVVEYRARRIFLSAQELVDFSVVKFMIPHLVIILLVIAYNLFTIGITSTLDVLYPNSTIVDYIAYTKEWVFVNFQTYFSETSLAAILFLLMMRLRKFTKAIGIGLSDRLVVKRSLFGLNSSASFVERREIKKPASPPVIQFRKIVPREAMQSDAN